ncbi:MAG: hypothetical protein Edafosvirus50_2 [Edafosvirus sp.]|uniref:Uncharacterized protein n=1 Tax=Edafosvirus sp. TaxID=2487765 RepID=A0A3G4ZVI5_9VIRU|nr:MAG: hypothetical protein Edafosvirus50_2 [Edafosvirus sp.]
MSYFDYFQYGGSYTNIFKFRNIHEELDGSFHPSYLFDTLNCLNLSYKYLSPVNGAILLKSGLLESMYTSTTKNKLTTFVQDYFIYDNKRSIPLSISYSDRTMFVRYMTPTIIAKIMGSLTLEIGKEITVKSSENFANRLSNDIFNDNKINELYETIEKLDKANTQILEYAPKPDAKFITYIKKLITDLNKQNLCISLDINSSDLRANCSSQIVKNINDASAKLSKLLEDRAIKTYYGDVSKNIITKYNIENAFINPSLKKQYDAIRKDTKVFLRALYDYYVDNLTTESISIFTILLAMLVSNTKSKKDFVEYFAALKSNVPYIFAHEFNTTDLYNPETITSDDIERCYYDVLMRYYDPIFLEQNNNVQIKIPVTGGAQVGIKSFNITDCNEIVVLNIMNMYRPSSFYTKNSPTLDKQVVAYYAQFLNTIDIASLKAHNAWTYIMADRDGIVYNTCIDRTTGQLHRGTLAVSMNFIYATPQLAITPGSTVKDGKNIVLSPAESVTIDTVTYTLVDKSKYYLFELNLNYTVLNILIKSLFGLLSVPALLDIKGLYANNLGNARETLQLLKYGNMNPIIDRVVKLDYVDSAKDFDNTGIPFDNANREYLLQMNIYIPEHSGITVKKYQEIPDALTKRFASLTETQFGEKSFSNDIMKQTLKLILRVPLLTGGNNFYYKYLKYKKKYLSLKK